MRRIYQAAKRAVVSFYDDQGTHHAAALTYYALMSLFPTLLLAVSLLGLLGEYPGTYNSIIRHLRGVVPDATLAPIDAAVRAALKSKGTATVALVVAILTALYGATGYLEAARRLGIPPERCAAIEDSHSGIRSARAAGMRVIAIPNPSYPPDAEALAQADVVIRSLDELTPELIAAGSA